MVEVERGGEHGDEFELELESRVAGIEGLEGDGRRRRRGGLGDGKDGGGGGCGRGGHDGWMDGFDAWVATGCGFGMA